MEEHNSWHTFRGFNVPTDSNGRIIVSGNLEENAEIYPKTEISKSGKTKTYCFKKILQFIKFAWYTKMFPYHSWQTKTEKIWYFLRKLVEKSD